MIMELFASLLFASAFALALSTIGYMLVSYRHRMLAALFMEPMPVDAAPSYKVVVRRQRVVPMMPQSMPCPRLVRSAA